MNSTETKNTSTDNVERDAAVRRLLGAVVVGAPARRGHGRLRGGLVATAAFLLGGAVVGGALSAAAATRSPAPMPSMPASVMHSILDGGHALGALTSYSGSGPATLDLGPKPPDATAIAVVVKCDGTGRFTERAGGEAPAPAVCVGGETDGRTTDGPLTDSVVAVAPESAFSFTVWAQWISQPTPPAPSAAQQAAVADGVISPDEYTAALNRLIGCLNASGYPVTNLSLTDGSFSTSPAAQDDGTFTRCYTLEFSEVGALWSSAHPG